MSVGDLPMPKLMRIKQDDENCDKLMLAARKNQLEIIKKLEESGVDITLPNKFGGSAFTCAIKWGQLSCLKYLAPRSDLNIAWHGRKPLALCMESPRPLETAQVLLETLKEQGKDAAGFINECDEFEKVVDLSPWGLEPRKIPGESMLHTCVTNKNIDMLQLLLSLGGNANTKDRSGETVLMRAIECGTEEDHEAFDVLLAEKDTRVDTVTREGMTPLHKALAIGPQRLYMIKCLIEKGADVTLEDADKNSAMSHAIKSGLAEILEGILPLTDPFSFQSANFHNSLAILPERIDFRPFVTDEQKNEVIKSLGKHLEKLKEKDKPEDGSPKKRKKKGQ